MKRIIFSLLFILGIATGTQAPVRPSMLSASKHHTPAKHAAIAPNDSCPAPESERIYLGWNTMFDSITGAPFRFGLFLDSTWTPAHHALRYYESRVDSAGNWTTHWKNSSDPAWHAGGNYPNGWLGDMDKER